MGWKIKIDTVEYEDVVFDHIEENLNGHIEGAFTLPNTATYRTLASTDHDVEFLYNDGANEVSEFMGIFKAPEYQQDKLLFKCYQECYEMMQRKIITGSYTAYSPHDLLFPICFAAGVTRGVAPLTPIISVRFDKTYCYDAGRYAAWVAGKDFYPDYDGVDPRFNIGTAGTGGPSGRGLLQYTTIPKRGKDRAKKRDKVYIKGIDSSGTAIIGEAGTGTNVYIGMDQTANDLATLNLMAEKKLADLNTEESGCAVPVTLQSPDVTPTFVQGYDVHAGDYVILNCETLDYNNAVVRTAKVTKNLTDVIVEVDKAEKLLDDFLDELQSWSQFGITTISTSTETVELLPNASFELGVNTPSLWDVGYSAGGWVSLIATDKVDGYRCCKCEAATATDYAIVGSTYIPIVAGRAYTAGAFCKCFSTGDPTLIGTGLMMYVYWYDTSHVLVDFDYIYFSQDGGFYAPFDGPGFADWTFVAAQLIAPAGAYYAKLMLACFEPDKPPAYVLYDAAVFRERKITDVSVPYDFKTLEQANKILEGET